MGFSSSKAQIIYTDLEPDFISEKDGDSYNLDVNNDGNADFSLTSNEVSESIYITSMPEDFNGLAATGGPFWSWIVPLTENTVISKNFNYYDTLGLMIVEQWVGNIDKYLGLQFYINGETHYGWARLTVISATQWVIKDYAYQSTPGTAILAGQKPAALQVDEEEISPTIKIAAYNKLIEVFNLRVPHNYELYNITGQNVGKGAVSKTLNTIDMSFIPLGVYVINLTNPVTGQTNKRKLVI
ncbi:T9SS type A sorting domain-containing protein [Formosa sp. S-31]|uniref:T9SS type A sorting domain-containing protein n=1 Tax=Formosa sp. S-31 TaxID=2790949 RepID=UPI003EBCC5BD